MLRIIQNTSAVGAKSYYSTADYYTEGQELTGQWRGEGARRLGLSGDVQKSQWDALCDNQHPQPARRSRSARKSIVGLVMTSTSMSRSRCPSCMP
ncbi:relaxase domain-containing protein [Planctomicrobium sp. SH527]|uniref:relaxase domain-containing protein n=1 Tax=Planctomicrobium sp. SH527 TaxID=3448123 RepID=UPI003F5C667A